MIIHHENISGTASSGSVSVNTVAAGTVLWTSGSMGAQTQPFTIDFIKGLPFFTGLTFDIVTANSTVTIVYE